MGYLYVIAASVMFGLSPVLSTALQNNGWSAGTILLSCHAMGAGLLLCLIKGRGLSLRVSGKQLLQSVVLGGVFYWMTTALLQMSYQYLAKPGLSTMLHFVYPIVVMVIMVIVFRERFTAAKLLCMCLSLAGIYLIAGVTGFSSDGTFLMGAIMALASGCTYALFIVANDKSGIRQMDSFVSTFYVMLSCFVYTLALFALPGGVQFQLSAGSVLCALALPLSNIAALVCISLGIHRIGSTRAAIINTLEPVVSLFASAIVFQDGALTGRTIAGSVCILAGAILLTQVDSWARPKEKKTAGASRPGP